MSECSELLEEVNQILNPDEKTIESALCSESNSTNCDINNINKESPIHKDNTCEENGSETTGSGDSSFTAHDTSDDDQLNSEIKIIDNDVAYTKTSPKAKIHEECNNNERVNELEGIVLQQQKKIGEYEVQCQELEHKCQQAKHFCADMESRLQTVCFMTLRSVESLSYIYSI